MADVFVLMMIESPGNVPDLARAAGLLGVDTSEMDAAFGVVPIDPENGKYAVQVRADAAAGPRNSSDGSSGPYSNPRIEGYGPKEGKR
ncbi:hypothetical protein [Rhizobium sp. S163]|uniref:hypothetical protein n=1 Tax=Rhizobium sp. S163 TaxID=3055039 RepID=UPI0025A992B0|nr:hypothetical protein [Rhizobium sp. S163]MDM9645360.1 hypothetical protein [Rhizobium sp. S163]